LYFKRISDMHCAMKALTYAVFNLLHYGRNCSSDLPGVPS
jgi:hypothetical protein